MWCLTLTLGQLLWVASILYSIGIWTVKLSILALYLRIFKSVTALRYATYGLIVVVTMAHWASVLTIIFGCTPVWKFWDLTSLEGTCVNLLEMAASESGLNVLTDLLVLTLPIKAVWSLRLPTKQKIIVAMTFLVGGA